MNGFLIIKYEGSSFLTWENKTFIDTIILLVHKLACIFMSFHVQP